MKLDVRERDSAASAATALGSAQRDSAPYDATALGSAQRDSAPYDATALGSAQRDSAPYCVATMGDGLHDSAPNDAAVDGLYGVGFDLYTQGRPREAAAFFQAMLRLAPTDERGWLALGNCHAELGHKLIALEIYSAGTIAAEPAPRCMLSRFRLLYDLNRIADANQAYEATLLLAAGGHELVSVIENERRIRP